jgi:hypothetical protein
LTAAAAAASVANAAALEHDLMQQRAKAPAAAAGWTAAELLNIKASEI